MRGRPKVKEFERSQRTKGFARAAQKQYPARTSKKAARVVADEAPGPNVSAEERQSIIEFLARGNPIFEKLL